MQSRTRVSVPTSYFINVILEGVDSYSTSQLMSTMNINDTVSS